MRTNNITHIDKGPRWWRSSRYLLALLAALGYACFFLQRVNLSLAIVCMVNHTAVDMLTHQDDMNSPLYHQDGFSHTRWNNSGFTIWLGYNITVSSNQTVTDTGDTHLLSEDDCSSVTFSEAKKEDGEFIWPKQTQGLLLSALFWGYFLLNIPAKWVIQRTGCKKLALGSILVLSLLSILSPVAARAHVWALITIRVVQGFATALGVSAFYAIWGTWAPKEERSVLLAIVFTGNMLANAAVFPSTGFLCRHGFAGGWPSVFYVFGIIGIVWCVLWTVFVFETPEEHPRIDPLEKKYIQSRCSASNKTNTDPTPWLKLLKSLPVWAVVTSTIGYSYPFFMFMAVLPQYMKEVLKFDIQSNGMYVMLPYIALFLISNIWALICKVFLAKKLLSVAGIRNLSTIIGDVIPSALYITISYLDCGQTPAVVAMMVMAIGISGTNMQGFLVNPYDIAPKYATAIFCIANTISVGAGIISPYVATALTIDKTREQWQRAIFSTVGVTSACLLFYLIFGSAHEMAWVKGMELEEELSVMNTEKETNHILANTTQSLLEEKEDEISFKQTEKPTSGGGNVV